MESSEVRLLIIVPVTRLSGKEKNLRSWILKLPPTEVAVLLVHDFQDSLTNKILRDILSEAKNPHIHMIEGTFNSPGLTRNAGVDYLTSDWTWFVDADDLPQVSNGLKIIGEADEDNEVLIGDYSINSKWNDTASTDSQTFESVAINPGLWRMIFKSQTISEKKFKNYRMGEDQLFLLDLGIFHRRVQFFNIPIYTYFRNIEGQLTSRAENIVEISNVIPETFLIFEEATGNEKKLIGIMLVRQIMTFIKNRGFDGILQLFCGDLKYIPRLRAKEFFTLFKSMLIVCKFKLVRNV